MLRAISGILCVVVVEVLELLAHGPGDDGHDRAETWPWLHERPGAERARWKGPGATLELLGEVSRKWLRVWVAKRVIDGVGAPEGIGGLARHDESRRRMRCTVVACQRPPRLVDRPSASSVATISGMV